MSQVTKSPGGVRWCRRRAEVPWRRCWGQERWSQAKTCCGGLARDHGEERHEGGSENRRKRSVVQPCGASESREEKLQVYQV